MTVWVKVFITVVIALVIEAAILAWLESKYPRLMENFRRLSPKWKWMVLGGVFLAILSLVASLLQPIWS